jgi:predicted RNA-binding protein with PUA-like domain
MAYWLAKSEPETFSWDDLVKAGRKGEPWTGVRNFQARANLAAMKQGDRVFYYHSGKDKAVVGIAEVVKTAYPDATAKDGNWICVDLKAVAPFKEDVSLAAIKADRKLADMVLVKNSRLSVQPVKDSEWEAVCKMGGVKA